MSILKYSLFDKFRPKAELYQNHFRHDMCVAKIPRLSRPGRRPPVTDATGEGDSQGGACSPLKRNYTNLAVLILTPGPMVEAATQLRIYWPLVAAGLALTMAPMRAL